MPTVLVVAGEAHLAHALREALTARDYLVRNAADIDPGLRIVGAERLDAVILAFDTGVRTARDSSAVVARFRDRTAVPIIVLSARTRSAYKARALDAGADDYVTEPFDMDEFLARLRAALRRWVDSTSAAPTVVRTATFTVDLSAKKVVREDIEIHVTPTEWAILEVLASSGGRLVEQRELLRRVWGPDYADETHYLRVYLAQLRRKLELAPQSPRHLITEPGMGYRFEL